MIEKNRFNTKIKTIQRKTITHIIIKVSCSEERGGAPSLSSSFAKVRGLQDVVEVRGELVTSTTEKI